MTTSAITNYAIKRCRARGCPVGNRHQSQTDLTLGIPFGDKQGMKPLNRTAIKCLRCVFTSSGEWSHRLQWPRCPDDRGEYVVQREHTEHDSTIADQDNVPSTAPHGEQRLVKGAVRGEHEQWPYQ